ncbi:hypothetical protein [Streptosporangium saharense]|uniref:Uncharacterized protein n=1 Tax=Streptosporangium saharense TaxID=1706840 RepID=A0A7W7VS91_9ACTN|nr:hypothetical protein [Streptosporangium saharense]MBB4920907.1 hypothetical protein [Streptosporangium saharense]
MSIRLMGGPLDGMSWPVDEGEPPGDGAYMIVPGEIARAVYEPRPDGDPLTWHHVGWIGGTPGGVSDEDVEDLIVGLGPSSPPADAEELLRSLDEIAAELEDDE